MKHVSMLLWAGEYLDIRTAVGSGANSTYPVLTVLPQWATPQFLILQFLLKCETLESFSIPSSAFQLKELKESCSDLKNNSTPIPTTRYTTPAAPPKAWATEQVNSWRITWWKIQRFYWTGSLFERQFPTLLQDNELDKSEIIKLHRSIGLWFQTCKHLHTNCIPFFAWNHAGSTVQLYHRLWVHFQSGHQLGSRPSIHSL